MSEGNFTKDLSLAINEYSEGINQENPDIKRIHEKINTSLNQIWRYLGGAHHEQKQKVSESDIHIELRHFFASFEKMNGFSDNEQKELDIAIANIAIAIREEKPDIFIQEMLGLFGIHMYGGRFRQGNISIQPLTGAIFTTKYKVRNVLIRKIEKIDINTLFAGVSFSDTASLIEEASPLEEQRTLKLYQYTVHQLVRFRADILELPVSFLEELVDFFHCHLEINTLERSLRGKNNILNKIQGPQDTSDMNLQSTDNTTIARLKIEIKQIEDRYIYLKKHLEGLQIERYPTNNEIWLKLHESFGITLLKNKFSEDKIIGDVGSVLKIATQALLTIANKMNIQDTDGMTMKDIHKLMKQISQKSGMEIPESWSQSAVRRTLDETLVAMALHIKPDYKFELKERRNII